MRPHHSSMPSVRFDMNSISRNASRSLFAQALLALLMLIGAAWSPHASAAVASVCDLVSNAPTSQNGPGGGTLNYTFGVTCNFGSADVAVSIPFDGTGGASVTAPSGGTFTAIGTGASYPFSIQLGPNPGFVSIQIDCTTLNCGTTKQLFYSARYPRVLNMTLAKSLTGNTDPDSSGTVTPGDVLTYTITSTNTSNVPLTNVTIDDPLITPNSTACPNVPVNATCVLVGTYTVTAADLANGAISNTAQSTSNELCGDSCTTFPATLRTRVFPPPAMTVSKVLTRNTDGDHSGNVTVGDVLLYTVTANNTGKVPLTNVVVNDPLLSPNTTTCTGVPSGGHCSLTGSYTVTATDLANGSIVNTGNATANNIPGVLSSNTVTTQVYGSPKMTVAKALTNNADGDGSHTVTQGDVLTYTVTATNTGNVPLTNVQLSDPLTTPNATACANVAPGANCVLSGTYTVTATDVSNGAISNTGTATSNEFCPDGCTYFSASLRTPVLTYAAMTVSKALTSNADGDGSGSVTPGDVLTFTVTATNTGNTTLTNVQVSDPLTTPNATVCASVAPAATCVLVGNYTVTSADAKSGTISNTGTAASTQVPTKSVTLRTPVSGNPNMTVTKTLAKNADGDHSDSVTAGDVLTYTVTVTNTGNVPLTNVQVTDPLTTPNSKTCPNLAIGASCVLNGTYTVTATDATNGAINNTGTATSNEFCGDGCTYFNSILRTAVAPTPPPSAPAMTVVKQLTANADGDDSGTVSVGDLLTYTVTATNTGNVTLTNVQVSDPLTTPNSATCASVIVGAQCVLTGTYTVTKADANNGSINNTGSGTASQLTSQPTSTLNTPVAPLPTNSPAMTVAKALAHNADNDDSGTVSVGDVLTYTVTATNTGNVTLTNVHVYDPLTTPSSTICASVIVGAQCVLTGDYTVTKKDATKGSIDNTGSATANQLTSQPSSTLNTPVAPLPTSNPAITVAKTLLANADNDDSGTVTLGDVLTYEVTATNTGNVTLTNVHVTDPLTTPSVVVCANVVPGATCVLTGTYTVAKSDVPNGKIDNTGTATANQLTGAASSSISTPVVAASIAYRITILSGNGQTAAPGQPLPQDFVVAVSIGDLATSSVRAQASIQQTTASLGGIPVQWQILSGGGSLSHGGSTTTDTGGHSSNHYTLGGSAGLNQVRVSVPGGASVIFNANSVVPNASLKIVSGDGQSLTTNTPSAPLVVQLLNNNLPVPSAVIHWSGNNAILASPTSITDSNGRATNTASVQNPGTATVTATSTSPMAGPVTFGLNGGISHLGGLTHQETEVANALDHACAALAASSSLTPAEQDLLRQCEALAFSAGANPDEARKALDELFSNVAFLQTSAALLISTEQFDNIKARIAALRSGTGGTHFGGLAYSTPDGTMPIGKIGDALLGFADAKADDKQKQEVGADFDRWGFFAAGTFGKGSADPRQATPGYGFHTNGLTAGVDYRYNDHLIFGVSAGYAKYNAGVDAGRGGMDTHGWSLSAYSTLFKQDSWYLDSVFTYGSNTYNITRRIIFTLTNNAGSTTVDQTATANSSGSTLAGALTLGRDFSKGPWSFGPYFRGTYTRIAFDNYQEVLQTGNGSGVGLSVQARDLKSVASVLGAKVNYASSQSWGILMPHAEVEWQHEFEDSPESITARFLHDPTSTQIQVTGDPIDTNYFRLGLGLSFVLPKGRSGFFYYEKTLGRSGITQDNLAIGIRLEF